MTKIGQNNTVELGSNSMTRTLPCVFSVIFAAICGVRPVASSAGQLAVDIGAGTLGATLSISQPIDPQTAIRFTYGTYEFARQAGYDNVVIDVLTRLRLSESFRIESVGLYVERSIRSPIHLTLGLVVNQNRIAAVSIPTESSVVINHQVYSAAQAGEVFTNVKWMPISPYIGFGFGPRSSDRRRLALVGELGAYYEGNAHVTFGANGAIRVNQSSLAHYFDTEKRQLSHELSPVQVFPVLQFGVRMRM